MLYAVLFIRCVWKYAGEVREIYSFFSVGKKSEGKSSFAILGFALGVADCKCAFSCAVANCFLFIVAPVKCILSVTKIYFAVSSFIIADDNIMLAVAKILNTVFNFVYTVSNFINAVISFISAEGKSINAVVNFINVVVSILLLPCTILIFLDYFKF